MDETVMEQLEESRAAIEALTAEVLSLRERVKQEEERRRSEAQILQAKLDRYQSLLERAHRASLLKPKERRREALEAVLAEALTLLTSPHPVGRPEVP